MKTIEVTVVTRTYTTYEVEVGDCFDPDAPGAYADLEYDYLKHSTEWVQTYEEIDTWDIDYVGDIK